MPPKATEKKPVAKKAAAFVQKEIDPTKYLRKQEILEPINPVTAPQLTGFVALVDKIYPEWSNPNQNWQDVQDSEENVKIPRELSHHGVQSIRTLLNLDSSESKVKSKGDTKKGKEALFEGNAEVLIDDEGRRLPRIVCCDDGSLNDYSRPLIFMRTTANEQIVRTSTQGSSTNDINSKEVTKNDVAVVSAGVPNESGGSNDVEVFKVSKGEEIDPCMCAAFRIIAEFASKNSNYTAELNPSDNRASNSRFLWNSIYPQLCTGRPVYNPTGKYTVRLFLGGKWRKVQVTDMVPMGPSGCAIPRSAEPYELWPLLLSKAVYSVYTACGYHSSLPTLIGTSNEGTKERQSTSSLSSAHKTSFFISFAVYVMTGWQPSTPRSVKETVTLDIQGARSLLRGVLSGGAQNITDREVPQLTPSTLSKGGGKVFQDMNEYQTKSYFKEEYNMRLAERAQVVEENQIREDLLKRLDEKMSVSLTEGYVLCIEAAQDASPACIGVRAGVPTVPVLTVPVLGVCLSPSCCEGDHTADRSLTTELMHFIQGEGKELSDYAILNRIKLLINWRTSPPISPRPPPHTPSLSMPLQEQEVQLHTHSSDAVTELLRELNEPLPPTSTVTYEWITLEELTARHAYLIGFDIQTLQTNTPYEAHFNWNWVPIGHEKEKEREKERGEKVADRGARASIKGKAGDAMKGSNVLCGDRGTCPPLLLTLDTTSFFISKSRDECNDAVLAAPPSAQPPLPLPLKSVTHQKTSISLSLLIYADATVLADRDSAGCDLNMKPPQSVVNKDKGVAGSSASLPVKTDLKVKVPPIHSADDRIPVLQGEEGDISVVEGGGGGGGGESDILPSGVTVILQEIRADGKEPYVMRAELSANARIPLTRTTFHIPSEGTNESTGRMVFWVRLFTKASVHLVVSSAVPVVLGEAEEVWASIGGSVKVREGEAAPTRHHTEQLLFRVPLLIDNTETSLHIDSGKDGNNESVDKALVYDSPSTSCKDSRAEHHVTAFLHISCREVARSVSLILSNGEAVSLPRIDGNSFLLSGSSNTVLTGRCYATDSAHRSPATRNGALPAFKWKLIIISSVPLSDSTASPDVSIVKALQQRYRGLYHSNNRLMLFKDVYSIDSGSFPIALRISLESLRASSIGALDASEGHVQGYMQGQGHGQGLVDGQGVNSTNNLEDVSFIVRLYRAADRTLIAESRGQGVLQLYNMSLEGLLSTPLHESGNTSTLDTPGKSKKVLAKKAGDLKGAGSGRKSLHDEIELIVECSIDETAMLVPASWRSRMPFTFNIDPADSSAGTGTGIGAGTGQGQMLGQSTCRSKSRDTCDEKIVFAPSTLLSSLNPATAQPQFRWQVDVLAGCVLTVSHDTYDLEAQMDVKNAWEEASQGRALRAAAAMAFALERRVLKAAHLLALNSSIDENMTVGTGTGTAAAGVSSSGTDRLVDHIAVALEKEDRASLSDREARLLDLEEYKEHIEDWRGTAPHVIEAAAVEMQRLERAQRKESTEVESRRINAAVLELNETMRDQAAMRIQSITAQAVAAAACIASHWELREAHRLDSLLKIQARKLHAEIQAADCAALTAAAELALVSEGKDRKLQKSKGVQ